MVSDLSVQIDHIFIFCTHSGRVADELVRLGLHEGSSRVHPGQGTVNRKFYFINFFLEILWVHDPYEIKKESLQRIGLTQRANYLSSSYSRFGLCIANTPSSDPIFNNALQYQPAYFPIGQEIEIIPNVSHPSLPWMFRLPFKKPFDPGSEPVSHKLGIHRLTKAIFEYTDRITDPKNSPLFVSDSIEFQSSNRCWLTLIFDDNGQQSSHHIQSLQLSILY